MNEITHDLPPLPDPPSALSAFEREIWLDGAATYRRVITPSRRRAELQAGSPLRECPKCTRPVRADVPYCPWCRQHLGSLVAVDERQADPARLTDSESGTADGSAPDPASTLTALQGSLSDLITKWRASAAIVYESAVEPAIGNVLSKCADELSAALAVVRVPQLQEKKDDTRQSPPDVVSPTGSPRSPQPGGSER